MEICQGRFETFGMLIVTSNLILAKGHFFGIYVASSSCSTAVAIDGAVNCIDDNGMTGHAEVVIRTPNTNSFIFILCMSIGKFPGKLRSVLCFNSTYPIDIVEVTVRFIFMFFIQFIGIESFIIKRSRSLKFQSMSLPSSFSMRTSSYSSALTLLLLLPFEKSVTPTAR